MFLVSFTPRYLSLVKSGLEDYLICQAKLEQDWSVLNGIGDVNGFTSVSVLNRIFTRIGLYFGKVWCQYQGGSIRGINISILILSLLFVHLVLNVKILAYYTHSELTVVVLPHTNGVYSIYSPYCLADHNSASAIQNAVGATEYYGGSKGL